MIWELLLIHEAVASTALENNLSENEQQELLNKLIKKYLGDK